MKISQRTQKLRQSAIMAIESEASELRANGMDVISLALGEPDFATPTHIAKAGCDAIRNGFTKYTAPGGLPELRERVAETAGEKRGTDFLPEQVCITNGAKQALANTCMAVLDPGDEVIVFSPYWVTFPVQVSLYGGRPVVVQTAPEDGFLPAVEDIEAAITKRTVGMIINSPSNPTGAVWPADLCRDIAAVAIENDLLMVSDEVYGSFTFGEAQHISVASISEQAAARTVVVDGALKSHAMTGWRIGWLIAPQEIASVAVALQSQTTSCANAVGQQATLHALSGPQNVVAQMRTEYETRVNLAHEMLSEVPGLRCTRPQGAFYLFPDVSALYPPLEVDGSRRFAHRLLHETGVAVVPGVDFGNDNCIRISAAVATGQLKKAVSRVCEFAVGLASS